MIVYGVEIDKKQLNDLKQKALMIQTQTPRVIKRALNDTAKYASKKLAHKAKEVYAVKVPRFEKDLKQKDATVSRLEAILKVKSKPSLLSDFQFRKNTKINAAKAKVLNSSRLKRLEKNGVKAFVVKFQSKKQAIVQRTKKERLPLKVLYSPSTSQMLGSELRVYRVLEPTLQDKLNEHIEKGVARMLEKGKE